MRRRADGLANLSRRRFLQGAGAVAGGLVLGYLAARSRPARATEGGAARADASAVGPWIRVARDGRITVRVEKAEMGQGIHSSLAALVAEELEVPWRDVAVEATPFEGALQPGMTGASMSIRDSWQPMRVAGAAARTMLVSAAAQAWGVAASECSASAGRVEHRATGRTLGYGELAARAARLPVPSEVELKSPERFTLIGTSPPRLDVPGKAEGSAVFGIDVKLDGMLHAAPALAPCAGASVEMPAADEVRRMPGVRAIVEIPNGVAVVADRYWQAQRAVRALAPSFSGGERPVDTPAYSQQLGEALATPGIVAGHTGDVAAALAGAAQVLEARYEVPWLAHATMEPMNCTASVEGDRCELWVGTQSPAQMRTDVGKALGMAAENVTVHPMLMGGGFGRRVETDVAVQAALASQAAARPVKLIWSREDDIRHDYYRPACAAALRGALDASGRCTAFSMHVAGPWSDRELPSWLRGAIGATQKRIGSPLAPEGYLPGFVWWRLPHLLRHGIDWIATGNFPPANYEVPSQRLEYSLVENPLRVGWWRAVPASQNAFFVESFVDELAHAANADPFEFRRALLASRDRAVLERAAEMSAWGRPRPDGRALGIAQYPMVGTSVCQVAEVSVSDAGVPRVHRVFCAIDCGRVVDPDTIRAQVEGGIVFGLSAALFGRITLKDGAVEQGNFHDYPLLSLAQSPEIEVQIVESDAEPSGVGELATPPIAPAVANAIFAATRRRIRSLPLA